jgi:hypothetical protein
VAECGEERLGDRVLGPDRAEPGVHVPHDLVGMPVEDSAEPVRLAQGSLDEIRVAELLASDSRAVPMCHHLPCPPIAMKLAATGCCHRLLTRGAGNGSIFAACRGIRAVAVYHRVRLWAPLGRP